jgi:hypothetical protein
MVISPAAIASDIDGVEVKNRTGSEDTEHMNVVIDLFIQENTDTMLSPHFPRNTSIRPKFSLFNGSQEGASKEKDVKIVFGQPEVEET